MYKRSSSSRGGSTSCSTLTYSRRYCRCSEASWRNTSTASRFGALTLVPPSEDRVHAYDIHSGSQVHLRERDHLSQSWLYLISAVDPGKMVCQLLLFHACNAATLVDPAFGVLQGVPPHIGCKDLHVPGIRKRK